MSILARPREFDREDVLERAMQVFWSKGYAATSISNLTDAMELSKSSLYDTFGSKHRLFLEAMDYYRENVTVQVKSVADLQKPAIQVISAVLTRAVDRILHPDGRRGCFLNNCAVEVGPTDPQAAARCRAGLAVMEETFLKLVFRAQKEGAISGERDPQSLARYLTSTINGIMVIGKANPDRTVLEDIVTVAVGNL
jgi:TetR/AcrR family transcriptional regulator, transcriptional repressor for nem operon